jgi:hypothetical protein
MAGQSGFGLDMGSLSKPFLPLCLGVKATDKRQREEGDSDGASQS